MSKALALALVLLACKTEKDQPPPTSAKTTAATTSPTATSGNAAPAAPEAVPAAPERNPKKGAPAGAAVDTSRGSCRVVASGDVNFEQVTGHTGSAVLDVYQWHTPETRRKLRYADTGMILNCTGDDLRLSITTARGKPFPLGTASYEVGGKDATLVVLGQIRDASITKASGTIHVNAFDDRLIAGRGSLDLTTSPDKGTIKLDLTFDMQCVGLSGCK